MLLFCTRRQKRRKKFNVEKVLFSVFRGRCYKQSQNSQSANEVDSFHHDAGILVGVFGRKPHSPVGVDDVTSTFKKGSKLGQQLIIAKRSLVSCPRNNCTLSHNSIQLRSTGLLKILDLISKMLLSILSNKVISSKVFVT